MSLTIARKLKLTFAVLLLTVVACGAAVWHLHRESRAAVFELSDHTTQAAALADAQSALWALRWGVAQYMGVTDPSVRQKVVDDGPKLRATLEEALKRFESTGLEATEQTTLDKLRQNFRA